MKKPAVVWRRKRASSKLLQSMDKPIFRPLPSQAPEKDFFVPECASVEKESVNIVTYGDCVGSASAPHAPSGARVAKPQRGYPCLTDNNSINDDNQELRYQRERKKREDKFYKDVIKPILTGYQNKATDMLQYRIEKGCAEHGEKSMGVLHLTFAEDVDYQTAQDRINSLATIITFQYAKKGAKMGGYIFMFYSSRKVLILRLELDSNGRSLRSVKTYFLMMN